MNSPYPPINPDLLNSPSLSQIWVFPIKSLDGVRLGQVKVLANGALAGDRYLALVDQVQNLINGKRTPLIHKIRASYNLPANKIRLGIEPEHQDEFDPGDFEQEEFDLSSDRAQLEQWFSDYFGFIVSLVENLEGGFPDDSASPAATLISTATLVEVKSWFPNLSLGEIRRRFRTNLEIENMTAFGEDRLFGSSERLIPVKIGAVELLGVNPCQRCPVPTRDSFTGEVDPGFQKLFVQKRKETLPDNVERSRFNHFYRLAVNTRISPNMQGEPSFLTCGDFLQFPGHLLVNQELG